MAFCFPICLRKASSKMTGQATLPHRNIHEKDLKIVTFNEDEILGFDSERHSSKQREYSIGLH